MATQLQSVSLDPEIAAHASEVAQSRGQTLEAFVEEAVSHALTEQAAFEEAMAEVDRDFAQGRTHSWRDVQLLLDDMRAEAEVELARRHPAS